MGSRKRINTHDWWQQYRESHGCRYEELGIPLAVLESEQRLKDFLMSGKDTGTGTQLDQVGEQEFWGLFQLITSAFDYEAAGFIALEKRRMAQ